MVNLNIDLPAGFLDEEIRCDYLVTKKSKEAWAVMLDLLSELDRVCTKHHIKYYASGGTLLGTIRHKGFIPWDDDIDVMMLRSDYEKLCEVANKEFHHPYFFQTPYTEIRYMYGGYAYLKNSMTTAIESQSLRFKFNQGIKIDIFPIDNVPADDMEHKKQIEKCNLLLRKYNHYAACTKEGQFHHPNLIIRMARKTLALFCDKWMKKLAFKSYRAYEKELSKYNNIHTEKVGMTSLPLIAAEKLTWKAEDFKQIEIMPFEWMTMPVGNGYEDMLQVQYGDWRTPVKGTSIHSQLFIDTDKPYTEYISK